MRDQLADVHGREPEGLMEADERGSRHWEPKVCGSEMWAIPVSGENVTGNAMVDWAGGCMAEAGAREKFPATPLGMGWAYEVSMGVGAGPG